MAFCKFRMSHQHKKPSLLLLLMLCLLALYQLLPEPPASISMSTRRVEPLSKCTGGKDIPTCAEHVVFTTYLCTDSNSCHTVRRVIEQNSKEIWTYLTETDKRVSFLDLTQEHISTNEYGVPMVRSLFHRAKCLCPHASTFTYTNADIIPNTHEFTETVEALLSLSNPFMAVGRRTNVNWHHGAKISGPSFNFEKFDTRSQFWNYAEDYFIVADKAIDWNKVPDFVIGRPGYDNWLVNHVHFKDNVSLVDVSNTLRMIHQTDQNGNKAGIDIRRDPADAGYNLKIGRGNFHHGTTDDADFYTIRTAGGTVAIRQRNLSSLRSIVARKLDLLTWFSELRQLAKYALGLA